MKKFITLLSFLSLVCSASAVLVDGYGVSWDVVVDGGVLELIGTGVSLGTYQQDIYVTDATFVPTPLSSGRVTYKDGVNDEAGDLGTVFGPDTYGGYNCFSGNSAEPDPAQALGEWFEFDLSGYGDSIAIEIWGEQNAYAEALVTGSIPVPEPMTVVLLSLGGLFLRRRK